ncbi:hypothetical protein NDU88_003826 [Pleurodeles waltl]|uniref:Uncharacterized protein n=1 Tax=Pleurodeles waltl TaxID=8319 RepID=A0AAV7RIJ2_PLEWA|nr:hypothetical protein NDU88_003826 [Pleurodeles waltl]
METGNPAGAAAPHVGLLEVASLVRTGGRTRLERGAAAAHGLWRQLCAELAGRLARLLRTCAQFDLPCGAGEKEEGAARAAVFPFQTTRASRPPAHVCCGLTSACGDAL